MPILQQWIEDNRRRQAIAEPLTWNRLNARASRKEHGARRPCYKISI